MKNLSWILLLLLLPQGTPPTGVQPAALDGVVVSFGTDIPIAKADVELRRVGAPAEAPGRVSPIFGVQGAQPAPTGPPIVTTSGDGKFSFKDVPPGNYHLYVTRASGYIPGEFGQRSPAGAGTPLTLTPGQSLSGVRLSMAPTSSISGRIVDGDGDPVPYARVQALRVSYEEGQRVLVGARNGSVDDRGEYRIYSLPPGEYYVAARPPDTRFTRNFGRAAIVRFGGGSGADAPVVSLRATDNGTIIEETWRAIFYPAAFDARSAQIIPVRVGENLRGIDINLGASAAPARHVKGTVINASTGLPAGNAVVRMLPRFQLTPSVIMPSATTDAMGRFDVGGVLAGSYSVIVTGAAERATAPLRGGLAPAPPLSGYAVVDVGAGNVENVQIPALHGVDVPINLTIPGTINDPALASKLNITLQRKPVVTGAPVGGGTITVGWPGLPQLVESRNLGNVGGSYVMQRVSLGDFNVEVSGLPSGVYVGSISLGRTNVLAEGLRVMGPMQNPLEIVLANDSGTVTGRVLDSRQQPSGNVTVVLVPDPARRYRIDLFQNVPTDSKGAFRIENVAPGEYKVFAWEEVVSGAWHDADYLRARENLGASVRVSPGRNEPVDVRVIPWSAAQ
jgi:hypothetical protein